MSQRDHDLMEAVTADDHIAPPALPAAFTASPPRRDSMEDADSSLTRKRPRLDNGSDNIPGPGAGTGNRQMPTTPARRSPAPLPPSTISASDSLPADQLVEMTIRSQPPSSLGSSDDAEMAVAVDAAPSPFQEPLLVVDDDDAPSDSSPAVIALDDEDADIINYPPAYRDIQEDPEYYFQKFPFAAGHNGDYKAALQTISKHFSSREPDPIPRAPPDRRRSSANQPAAQDLDGTVLPSVCMWLDSFPDRPSQYQSCYRDRASFWNEFANMVWRVLSRRCAFGDGFCDDNQTEDEVFYSFLRSYVRLCARLLHVEAQALANCPADSLFDEEVTGCRHVKNLHAIFRPDFHTHLGVLLVNEYKADVEEMRKRLVNDFAEAPVNGGFHVLAYTEAVLDKVNVVPKTRDGISFHAGHILVAIGELWQLLDGDEIADQKARFHRGVLDFFRRYDAVLQEPSRAPPVDQLRDVFHSIANLLSRVCHWDVEISVKLAEELLPTGHPDSPTASVETGDTESSALPHKVDEDHRAALVKNAWKFKLLKKYIVKGRMDVRVASIIIMDKALIDIWSEYNITDPGFRHPVLQYLAKFILHEQVIEYIISVDSHPQLISRSGNIVGFLVVTGRYSESQTDAIWNTVANSPDFRVVSATLLSLKTITGLMHVPDLLYLCTKLYSLPIESYTMDTMRFLSDLYHQLRDKRCDWRGTDHAARPWNVCIRIMQEIPPSRDSTTLTIDLYHDAAGQLERHSGHSSSINPDERRRIFMDRAVHMSNNPSSATGCVRAIWILCSKNFHDAVNFFRHRVEITHGLLDELCHFVKTENQQGYYPSYVEALETRLSMLEWLVTRAPDAVTAITLNTYGDIWDATIGKYAWNNQFRDQMWLRFLKSIKHNPDNAYCKQLISLCVPNLEPQYFTPGMFEFVASYQFTTTRQTVSTDEGDKVLLQIRGADLLWRLVWTAPEGTIEDRAAKLLAARYVEVNQDLGVTVSEVEDAHVALVEKCNRELLSAYKTLRSSRTKPEPTQADDSMVISLSDDARRQTELRFCRTALFEKLLLETIRTKPAFSRVSSSDPASEALPPTNAKGETRIFKFTSPWSQEREILVLGTENTLEELEHHVCAATGYTKVNIFCYGQKLNHQDKLQEKLECFKFGHTSHLLVQKAAGSDTREPKSVQSTGGSVFETSLLEHFEELFACMDSDDAISSVLFDLLTSIPFRERIADDVASGKALSVKLFPPGKPFQAQYAACALDHRLKEQLRNSNLQESFLLNAIQLLEKAILNKELLEDRFSGSRDLDLASVLVNVLLKFLKERPAQDVSTRYFSDAALLVDRLVGILSAALKSPPYEYSLVACHAYATILEASLHSRGVWDPFMDRADILSTHKELLLSEPRQPIRKQISTTIESVCGGDLPTTSPLETEETATRFWSIISEILPDAVKYPSQSEELFMLAEQLFRINDENSRDEDSLRKYLASWSDFLLHYSHEEFVGRDEIDHVVLGFTKLLSACILSLKSFKKPLHAGPLMEKIFRKYLFAPRLIEIDDESTQVISMPVLESNTRKELYDLTLALADDRSSFNTLLGLTGTLAAPDIETPLFGVQYSFDRANEIRSATGYVGLNNPRAICYMNSLITQLYMNVNFRKFILGLNVQDSAVSQRMLWETQKLFATMQNSYRKSADPHDFAISVKGIDGMPIDVNIQMDADELFNLFIDQMEGQMPSAETKQQFRSFYGGQTVNQIKSKDCDHVSERVEGFSVIQCDVQGKSNLVESLHAFVEGDVMEGDNKYKCEQCGGVLVNAVKRTCLKHVPDNLICHLKRFDYDLSTQTRHKINDSFAFPDQLDVSPYNVDHLSDPSKPRQEDYFELVGVLVHQGNSENGHYYSYIRERPSPSSGPTWFEFNDRDVNPFDPRSIPYQTYGGWFDDQFPHQQKHFSAYMLFYQRKDSIIKDHHEYISSSHCGSPKVFVPQLFEEYINGDNENFIRDYCLHDPNHSKFIRQTLTTLRSLNHGTCSEDHQQETLALHTVLDHLHSTTSRQKNTESFEETMTQLRKSISSCHTCCAICLRWLAESKSALTDLLLRCAHPKIRSLVRAFLADTLKYLRAKDPAAYFGVESPDVDMETGMGDPTQGILLEVVRRLRQCADESWVTSRGWDDFYLTLCQVARMGPWETAVLLNNAFLEFCLKVLTLHSQRDRLDDPLWLIVDKKKNIYNRMIEFACVLFSHMDIRIPSVPRAAEDFGRLEHYDTTLGKFPLSQIEDYFLKFWDDGNTSLAALDRMIDSFDPSKTEIFWPGEVLKWMLQSKKPNLQAMIIRTLIEGIGCNPPFSDPYVRVAATYCETSKDLNHVMDLLDTIVKRAATLTKKGGEAVIEFLVSLLTMQNEAIFDDRNPDFFRDYARRYSHRYAIALLIYEDEFVRKATAEYFERLFRLIDFEKAAQQSIKVYYLSVRRLVTDIGNRIVHEQEMGSRRYYMEPLIETGEMLTGHLTTLIQNPSPLLLSFKQNNDITLVHFWNNNIEPRLRNWLQEEDTPISTGGELDFDDLSDDELFADEFSAEPFEHSDYESVSDVDDTEVGVDGENENENETDVVG